jgi:hypothetical protein
MTNNPNSEQLDLVDLSQTTSRSNSIEDSSLAYLSSNKSNKSKYFLTFVYCLVFWNFGLCVGIFGPTLLDFSCQTSSSLSTMSLLYFFQNLSAMGGVFLSGILLKNNRIKIVNFMLVCTILMPIFVALMPISKNILFLAVVMIALGFNMGSVDNVANLGIMKLHNDNVSCYLQAMHFFYGVGAFVVSLNLLLGQNRMNIFHIFGVSLRHL